MGKSSRVQHEGIVKSISTQTLEVSIISHSACSGCHAKSACGIADMKEKVITAQRPREELRPGDKVIVYASVNNAFYSVLLAYIMPSILIIATILLAGYFIILYFCRNKIARKINFTVEKIANY